jgi:uncharacterized protein
MFLTYHPKKICTMKTSITFVLALAFLGSTGATIVLAQRGMDEANGVPQQGVKPKVVLVRGGGPPPWAGNGARAGRGGPGPDATFLADREIFHSLLEDHQQIQRTVTKRPDGVETLTESDDPNVALAIQGHVAAMHDRVKKIMPIHMRDPLFAAVFGHTTKIKMEIKNTKKGVRVVETSDDPYVAKLIQAHAKVVSKFVANGFPEAQQDHNVPKK